MILKNQFEVSYEEAILLLENITESLQLDKSFSFELKGHEAKVEVEEPLNLSLTISPNRFTIEFLWGKLKDKKEKETEESDESESDWRDDFDQELEASAGIVVDDELEEPPEFQPLIKEVKLPEEIEVEEPIAAAEEELEYEETYEEVTPSVQPPTRALSQKMILNTTTLSFEGGFWTPAFSVEEINSEWSLLNIDQELDNRRWDPSEDISSPAVKQPESRRAQSVATSDEDLFSDLDQLDTERSTVVPKTKTAEIPLTPSKKAPPKKSASPGIPAPRTVDIDKKKATIPAPSKTGSKKLTIPKPDKSDSGSGQIEEITEWKEPDREDISSGDDWVKPSEVLKTQKKSPKILKKESATIPAPAKTKKAQSPPPKAVKKSKTGPPKPPDKKGKKDDKKGWADWK